MEQTVDASLAAYGLENYYFNLKRHQDALKIGEVKMKATKCLESSTNEEGDFIDMAVSAYSCFV